MQLDFFVVVVFLFLQGFYVKSAWISFVAVLSNWYPNCGAFGEKRFADCIMLLVGHALELLTTVSKGVPFIQGLKK